MKDIFLVSIIQGITEFLPVSSSGHLQLISKLYHIPMVGRTTEVALHLGTVLVIFAYFWRDLMNMIEGLFSLLRGKILPGFWLLFFICLATIPVVICGYMVDSYGDNLGRTLTFIGWASIISGVLLYVVDHNMPTTRRLDSLTIKDSLIIGVIQCIALVPGVSRLGSTLIAGRLLGFKRTEAARFSFLLSIPAILGAATLTFMKLTQHTAFPFSSTLFLAMAVAFVIGLFVLFLFMSWLRKFTLTPFAIYRIIFGLFVLYFAYF